MPSRKALLVVPFLSLLSSMLEGDVVKSPYSSKCSLSSATFFLLLRTSKTPQGEVRSIGKVTLERRRNSILFVECWCGSRDLSWLAILSGMHPWPSQTLQHPNLGFFQHRPTVMGVEDSHADERSNCSFPTVLTQKSSCSTRNVPISCR